MARQGEWPVLEGLDAAARTSLLQRSARRKFDRHEVVFHENDPGDTFHLIEQGLVEIQITTPLGDVQQIAHFDVNALQQPENITLEPGGAADVTFNRARQVARIGKDSSVTILATLPASNSGWCRN